MQESAAATAGTVPRTIGQTLVVASIVIAGAALLWWRDILLLLFAGIVVATALQPICDFIAARLNLRPSIAAVLVYGLLFCAFAGLAIWLAPQVWDQGAGIFEKLPDWYSRSREWLVHSHSRTLVRVGGWLPDSLPPLETLDFGGDDANPFGLTRTVLMELGGVLAVGGLAFYWSINREKSLRALFSLVPEHRRPFYEDLSDALFGKLGAYVRGQLILCGLVGGFSLVAFWLIGLPYSLLLALVAGILEAVPVFGPTLGAVPAILVALSISPQTTLMVVAAAICIQMLENYLFVPKVMDRSVGISAVVTLLSLVAFGALFGLLGAVLAIPLAAIVQTLFDKLVLQAEFKEKDVVVSRDFTGVMRYQLLDLIHDVQRQQRQKDIDVDDQTTAAFNEIESLAVSLEDLLTREEAEEPPPIIVQARSA
jgi:predicted PurR-regulated permease PerM